MAASAVLPVMNGGQGLLSFFSKTDDSNVAKTQHECSAGSTTQYHKVNDEGSRNDVLVQTAATRPKGKTQQTLQEIFEPKPSLTLPHNGITDSGITPVHSTESDDSATSSSTRKRRRTSQCIIYERAENDIATQYDLHHSPIGSSQPSHDTLIARRSSPVVMIPTLTSPDVDNSDIAHTASGIKRTPPRKMLRLNASGKFSSPISKPGLEEGQIVQAKRRGRSRQSDQPTERLSLVVKLVYGKAPLTGEKIARIQSGEERIIAPLENTTSKQRKSRPKKTQMPTHPFFSARLKQEPCAQQLSPRKATAITPGKLKRETSLYHGPAATEKVPELYTSALLKDRLIARQPGAKDPAWPNQGFSHIRGLDRGEPTPVSKAAPGTVPFPRRKGKLAQREFPQAESILVRFAESLEPEPEGRLREDGFCEPNPSLKIPRRKVVPGNEIALGVEKQLGQTLRKALENYGHLSESISEGHPAVLKLLERLPHALSSFDQNVSESLSWAHKYAPVTSGEVLQPAREMDLLKKWLSSLTVKAVESASKSDISIGNKSENKTKRKRPRRNDEMADFLADDDEIVHDWDALTDPGTPGTNTNGRDLQSVVHSFDSGTKVGNVLLLSGPHGCGKSAAAYAVAKELGFKVFEINSSERRTGRDVLDKVGNMTENHLVKHHGAEAAEYPLAEEPSALEEAFKQDLENGRQCKMSAFFKVDSKSKAKKSAQDVSARATSLESVQAISKSSPKEQQQSLVLLEEVDVLFKEDKDFWSTVLKLVTTSKRPFIMTCNDEDLVPLQALPLHAILRFSAPDAELAADALLLIAATEGHQLRRDAMLSLYESHGRDFRCTINKLNFWCQFGVGDPRGGLSWMYQRWPPGSDLDGNGRRLRVISEDTCQVGMGMRSESDLDHAWQLLSAYQKYGLEPREILDYGHSHREALTQVTLKQAAFLAETMSTIDIYSGHYCSPRLDTSQAPMKDKARGHYIDGMALLQTDEYIASPLEAEISITSTLVAYRAADLLQVDDIPDKVLAATVARKFIEDERPATFDRHGFACFDVISSPPDVPYSASGGMLVSVFDGPLQPIVTDISPFVRSILRYERALAEQREHLSTAILGPSSKRSRKTRAARSALEGSQRESTRRERWFPKTFDVDAVLATGGDNWPWACTEASVGDVSSVDGTEPPVSSAEETF